MKPNILIVDDCSQFLKVAALVLRSSFEVDTCPNTLQAKKLLALNEYLAVILDLHFEGQEEQGTQILELIHLKYPRTKTIVITGHSQPSLVIEASQQKHDLLLPKSQKLIPQIEKALFRFQEQTKIDTPSLYPSVSPLIKTLLQDINRIMSHPVKASILVTGETGVGKEKLVQYIAAKLQKRVVSVNMANVQKETGESILFGHERGAFTGAHQNKVGLIESAHQGILFLDEIGECSMGVQAKLLRTLQENQVTPFGSNQSRSIEVRFIAATHQNIPKMIEEGTFRLDLYQRLSTFSLHLPSLRDRPEDILFYAHHFLDSLNNENKPFHLTHESEELLQAHPWPGNIRELKNVIQRAMVFTSSHLLDATVIEKAIGPNAASIQIQKIPPRARLKQVLDQTYGNRRQAARILGVSEMTVYRWLKV